MWMALTTVASAFIAGFIATSVMKKRAKRLDAALEKVEDKVQEAYFRTEKCERICATAAASDVENGLLKDIELRCLSYEYSIIKRRRRLYALRNKLCKAKTSVLAWSAAIGAAIGFALCALASFVKGHLERGEGLCSGF